jgi:hypothetical protein
MKKVLVVLTALTAIIIVTIVACNRKSSKVDPAPVGITELTAEEKESRIRRGEYLVSIMGCDDCHTPKIMGPKGPQFDMGKRLSGHPSSEKIGKVNQDELKSWVLFNHQSTSYVGPWGVSFAANLTSDDTGIGTWSEEQFITAIRKGKFKGLENSRELLPPMPWPVYKNATDDDLKAIYAYLQSTPPVENVVPAAIAPNQLAKL